MPALADVATLTPQQRRTRAAIVAAAARLLATDPAPSATAIAREAEVARRTVYLYFPSLDLLLLDAAIGESAKELIDLAAVEAETDVLRRVEALVRAVQPHALKSERLGRMLMRLAAEEGDTVGNPRGHRRVGWIELALAPVRRQLPKAAYEQLVSALAMLVGWEPAVILRDVRGLETAEAVTVSVAAARAVVRDTLERHGIPLAAPTAARKRVTPARKRAR